MNRTLRTLAALTALVALAACGAPDAGGDETGTPPTTTEPADAQPTTTPTTSPTGTQLTQPTQPPTSTTQPHLRRGEVVSLTHSATQSPESLQALLDQMQIPTLQTAKYGLEWWTVEYRTIDAHGDPTVASGTVIVPIGTTRPLTVVSDQHGTQTLRVPPTDDLMAREIFGAGLLFGSQGHVVVGADYLGLGVSDGVHPYYHAASEASAALDMLVAARRAAADLGVHLSDELFLTGYSQGAHVTMALHRELERTDHGFTVIGAAPMAGAYDLDQVSVPMSLADPAPSTPMYLAYALLGLNEVYGFASHPGELFVGPWADAVPTMFDGTHSVEEIAATLPANPAELLQPPVMEQLRTGTGRIGAILAENSVYDWTPRAPVRILHGTADQDVPFLNAEVATKRMRERGADVELVPLDGLDHTTASMPAYLHAAQWLHRLLPG